MSITIRPILAPVVLAAMIGFNCLTAAAPSIESQDQILAHIDSLHAARQVEATRIYIEPFLADARAAGDSVFVLPLVAKLGRLWAAFGEPRQGEPLLREAAELAAALDDSLPWCDALRWLGYSVEQQGRSTEAVAIYEKQLEISRARGDQLHEGWALVGLAYRAGQEGRYGDSITDYLRASRIFRELDETPAAVWTLNGLGAALQQNGQFEEAARIYGEVAELAKEIGYVAVEALALNNQASMEFSLGDPGVAMEYFRRAGQLQRQISQNQDAVSSGTNEAISLYHLGRLDEAVVLLESLLEECERGNFFDRESYVLRVLADVRRAQGRLHEAAAIYRRILVRDDASLDLQSRIESLTGLAAAMAEMDSSAAALDILLTEENLHRSQMHGVKRVEFEQVVGDRLLETGQFAAALTRYEYVIEATTEAGLQGHRILGLAGAARCRRALGQPEEALALLREASRSWEDTRGAPRDPEWREQRGSSGRLVYSQLAALILGSENPDQSRMAEAFDAVQAFKGRTLAERIGRPDHKSGWPVMTLHLLQTEVLKEGEIFLDAYLGPTESVLFAVTTDECRAVFLDDEKTLTGRLRLHHELLSTSPPPEYRDRALEVAEAAGKNLGREILGKVAPLIEKSGRVIFAPDGPLNLVPLVTVAPAREPGTVWLRVPSATILGYFRRNGAKATTRGQGILAAAATATPGGLPLPGAVQEVKQLARRYRGVDLRLAGSGDAPLVPTDLARYDILHLATHARVDDQRPWSSEIVLDANDPDGRLLAGEIAELDLSARLAVLSACETGSGRILSGEGVLGLSSGFMSAGVPVVVASLWPVADEVTTVLMGRFYEGLSRGNDPATALALAQNIVRSDPATAHPFHWAGFVVMGDGTVPVVLEIRPRPGPVAGFFIATGMIIVLVIFVRKRLRPRAVGK
jgi:tetratricopeptide (TPR) repeat protein